MALKNFARVVNYVKIISNLMKISFILPCLNEEDSLGHTLTDIYSFVSSSPYECEIIVADNGSSDNSAAIASQFGATVINAAPIGYGAAIKAGIKASQGDIIIMGDADRSYPFKDSHLLIAEILKNNDLVIGSRIKNTQKGAMPLTHKYIGTPLITFIGNTLFNTNLSDYNSGFRAFKKQAISKLCLEKDDMCYASEMIIKSQTNKLKIQEIDINFNKDSRIKDKSKLVPFRDGFNILKLLFSHFFRHAW